MLRHTSLHTADGVELTNDNKPVAYWPIIKTNINEAI